MNTARISYVLATWTVLWGFAGGTTDLFWSRLPITTLIFIAMAIAGFFAYTRESARVLAPGLSLIDARRAWLFRSTRTPPVVVTAAATEAPPPSSTSFVDAVRLPWVAIPLVLLLAALLYVHFGLKSAHPSLWLTHAVAYASPDVLRIILFTLFVAAYSFVVRALLQKEWGSGNVVILMAITVGFASQSLGVFLVALVMGWVFGQIADRVNLLTSWVGEVLWFLLFFAILGFSV